MERTPNAEQLQVVQNVKDNLIVFASAGTGKTFTVANRIAHILQTEQASPQEILCLTFTTKACEELREDIFHYVGKQAEKVEIRTIHGFCFYLMREEHRRQNDSFCEATVCDEQDCEALLKSILSSQYATWENGQPAEEEAEFEIFSKRGSLRDLVSELKHIREEQELYSGDEKEDFQRSFAFLYRARKERYNDLFSLKRGGQVRDEAFESAMQKHAGRLVFEYNDYLRQSNRVDYDDLILFASMFLKKEEIGARWEKRYRYIIVDEMQDTSMLEYSVLKRIFGKNNVMMCGDFFQSIYEWRGSNPKRVLGDFTERYSPKMIMFSENYRSTKTLTGATFGYLQNTYPDLMGKYCPADIRIRSAEAGDKILLCGFDNRHEEALQIFRYIQKHKASTSASICVMTRSNPYIATLHRAFEEQNRLLAEGDRISFYTAEEYLQFYRKPVIKDVLAVLKLLLNKTDRLSMERVTEKYVRLVGLKTIEQLRSFNGLGVSIISFLEKQTYDHGDPYHLLTENFQTGDIVVYDTETTGLDLSKDEMVQLSAIRMNRDGEIVATFDQMVIPNVEIGEGAYQTHGFDMAYIQTHGGISAKEALARFSDFVKGRVLVGHNSLHFDAPLVRRQLAENGLPPLDIKAEYDTLVMAKQFYASMPSFKLSALCEKFGIVNEAAHNAYGDIVATGKVLCRMITEVVLPNAEKRKEVCAKNLEKFEKLYAFIEKLQGDMKQLSPRVVAQAVVEGLRIRSRYTADSDGRALDELLQGMPDGKVNTEAFLHTYLSGAELAGSRADLFMAQQNRVPILTVHQAKGCEFDVVILAGADDRNFPNFYAKNAKTEEEERKIFYVAISRAKKKLILTRAAHNGRERLYPSPYVTQIPAKFLWKNEGWDGIE